MKTIDPDLQIVFRHLEPSDALSECIASEYEQLNKFYGGATTCQVVVEHGDHFGAAGCQVHVQLNLRGATLVADRVPTPDEETDAYTEIREAFRIVRRQLTKYAQQQAPRSGSRVADHLPH